MMLKLMVAAATIDETGLLILREKVIKIEHR